MREVGEVEQEIEFADFLSAAQIYLQDNCDLARPLAAADIKPRLLGHWGTCHGVNVARANLRDFEQRFAEKLGISDFRYVVGVGHGFPAVQAGLWLDRTIDLPLETLCQQFSWPHGFSSHTNPQTPGTILEGGELGYSLGVAYGAAMDAPERFCAVLIGDGEMETGALLASLNLNKLLSARGNGIVLPILHLNGYKISQPSIYGRISEKELADLISGFGYQPLFVEGDVVEQWREALERCIKIWYGMRQANFAGSQSVAQPESRSDPARSAAEKLALRMPFIIMRSTKGEGVSPDQNERPIAGTARSHQVPFAQAKSDPSELALLEKWLKSYRFTPSKAEKLRKQLAKLSLPLSAPTAPTTLPSLEVGRVEEVYQIGQEKFSSARAVGQWLQTMLAERADERDLRFLSPDETNSNQLDAIFASTGRAWQRAILPTDQDLAPNGRVVELLSENTLFSLAMGYSLTGRRAYLASYEAFLPIVASQADQYLKFLNQSSQQYPALNLLSTSVGWRQDHNGYSHQNPSFIANLLLKPSRKANCYFPIDDVAAVAALEDAAAQSNRLNLITFDKNANPRWIDSHHAEFQLQNGGLSEFQFASSRAEPAIICAGCGDIVSREMLYAMQLVRERFPELALRFVGIGALSYRTFGTVEQPASPELFKQYFGQNTPIVAAFHGYATTLETIFARYTNPRRVLLRGYEERGSTTTPLEMLMLNQISRYNLATDILKVAIVSGKLERGEAAAAIRELMREMAVAEKYLVKHGVDREKDVQWQYKIQS